MSKSSYVDLEDGKWFTFDRPQKIACCSCNHVHLVELRLHEGLMQMRMITDKPRCFRYPIGSCAKS